MQCPHCKTNNPDAMKFCGGCGNPIATALCANCQFSNPPSFKFCGNCGEPLASVSAQHHRDLNPKDICSLGGERRQLTVMFCDLVGSTALSRQLDPEDLNELIQTYRHACTRVIEHFDGYIAQFMGDGIMAYFGYPHAHEDDAERAVRSGLDIIQAIKQLELPPLQHEPIKLAVRIGIATGVVVASDPLAESITDQQLAVGETPNLAARLQGLATSNTIVISPRVHRHLGDLFLYKDLGMHSIKGINISLRLFQVLQPRLTSSRFEAARATDLTPMVNREEELALLMRRWQQSQQGEGQVVLLTGEAGIGKSRITLALSEQLEPEFYTRLRYQCSPYHSNSTLYPVIDQLERAARFKPEDDSAKKLEKLLTLLSLSEEKAASVVPLFTELLSIPTGQRYPSLNMSPQQQREQTFAVMFQQLYGLAAQKPLMIVVEDVHWIDPTTCELLDLVVDRIASLRIFLIITFRPDFTPPWTGLPHVSLFSLNRLSANLGETLVKQVSHCKTLPRSVLDQIIARTDGVPLFLEELTKTMLHSGLLTEHADCYELNAPLPPRAVPSTLQDSLMARLDQLSPVKMVAQIGSAIGREFSHELLAAVSEMPEAELTQALEQLVKAELMFCHGTLPTARYIFKHALVQDAAYDSLLRSQRRRLHARIAKIMEEGFPELWCYHPELLAQHYTEADLNEKAVNYWLLAGQQASERSANIEAINHLRKGLVLLKTLPSGQKQQQQELALLIALGPVLITTKGTGSEEAAQVYSQAVDLCARLPDSPSRFTAFWGQWRISQGYKLKHERANKLVALSEVRQDPELRLQAHHCQWGSLFNLGLQQSCYEHIEKGLTLFNTEDYRAHALIYGGHDPGVCAHGQGALALWLLGRTEQAQRHIDHALSWAYELNHAGSLAHIMEIVLMFNRFCLAPEQARQQAEAMITFSEKQRLSTPRAKAVTYQGWTQLYLGDPQLGQEMLRQGIETQQQLGTKEDFPFLREMLAEAYGLCGLPEQGLQQLQLAFTEAEKTDQWYWLAELHRRKGELLLTLGDTAEAETAFQQALKVACHQQVKSLELRAAMSLVRLAQIQGDLESAQQRLALVYASFTEGLDSPDLEAARALLPDLI